jgi:hypothetical protein
LLTNPSIKQILISVSRYQRQETKKKMAIRDGHVNGVTDLLYNTDLEKHRAEAEKERAVAASAPRAKFVLTTDQGKKVEFELRRDLVEQSDDITFRGNIYKRYLLNMATRKIMGWENIISIEEVA